MIDLESLSVSILKCQPTQSKILNQDQKPLVLSIKKLKRFMVQEKTSLVTVSILLFFLVCVCVCLSFFLF